MTDWNHFQDVEKAYAKFRQNSSAGYGVDMKMEKNPGDRRRPHLSPAQVDHLENIPDKVRKKPGVVSPEMR